jgi:hypothetical protein
MYRGFYIYLQLSFFMCTTFTPGDGPVSPNSRIWKWMNFNFGGLSPSRGQKTGALGSDGFKTPFPPNFGENGVFPELRSKERSRVRDSLTSLAGLRFLFWSRLAVGSEDRAKQRSLGLK